MEYRVITKDVSFDNDPIVVESSLFPLIAKAKAIKQNEIFDYVYVNLVKNEIRIDTVFRIDKR